MVGVKTCTKCKRRVSLKKFHKQQDTKDGLRYWCKDCVVVYHKKNSKILLDRASLWNKKNINKYRDAAFKRKYGVDLKEYSKRYKEQEGKCGCCHKKIPKFGTGKVGLDHNHISSQVRGILCTFCNNRTIAVLEDHEKLLTGLQYLKRWEPEYVESLFIKIMT